MTYRAELSGRALKQMRGLTSPAFDRLIEAMAEFGEAGLITHLISDGARLVIILDIPWAG